MSSDQSVQMQIEVIVRGQQGLKELTSDVRAAGTATAEATPKEVAATEAKKKSSEQTAIATKAQSAYGDTLKGIAPILQATNLGFLAQGFGIAAASAGLIELIQAAAFYASQTAATSATVDLFTGALLSNTSQTADAKTLGKEYGVSVGDVKDSIAKAAKATGDYGVALNIASKALQLHNDTGISTAQATDDLIAAYQGAIPTIGQGVGALNTAFDRLDKNTNGASVGMAKFADNAKIALADVADAFSSLFDKTNYGWDKFFEVPPGTVKKFIDGLVSQMGQEWDADAADFRASVIGSFKNTFAWVKAEWDKGMKIGEWLLTLGGAAYDTISGAVRGFFLAGFKGIANGVIGILNDLIMEFDAIHFTLPTIGGVGGGTIGVPQIPKIPTLDTGGIVTRPTLAALAMNGRPEAVIPLGAGAGSGGPTTIILQAQDGTPLMSWVWDQVNTTLRQRGGY